MLRTIEVEKQTCDGKNYFCFGPQWYTNKLVKAGISDLTVDLGVKASRLLRNGRAYKSDKSVVISHLDFDDGDMRCDKNNLLKELCKRYNMTPERYKSPRTKQQTALDEKALSVGLMLLQNYQDKNQTNITPAAMSVKALRPLVWVYIPKSGIFFLNTLLFMVCPKWPPD